MDTFNGISDQDTVNRINSYYLRIQRNLKINEVLDDEYDNPI